MWGVESLEEWNQTKKWGKSSSICTGNTPCLRSGFVALPVEAVRVVEKRRAALVERRAALVAVLNMAQIQFL